jgi:3-oxoadipate enol-lactonase
MPKIQANGIQLYYELTGPADRPVVLLSNSLGTRLEMWDPQMQALTERYRVLRYDSRGHGRSDAPQGPYTIEVLAADAIGLLDALEIERVHFCGLSKGGMVGQMLGAKHGERLVSLALCSTACHMPARELWDERIRVATEQGMAALADGVVERWFTEAFRREPSITVDRVRQMIIDTPPHGYAACCAAIRDMDLRELITGIRAPTLVIVGEDDPATPPERAREIQSRIPGAQLEVIPDAAHLVNIEQDVAFDAALASLLDHHRV